MSAAPLFTVLLPVHRPPHLLPLAIDSVLAQDLPDFELFVICDGAPPATADCAQAYAARDPRVRVFVCEKGERNGEAHRHSALAHARSPLVAQIGDDDLWFPDHLSTLARVLERADFGHVLQAECSTTGELLLHIGNLADPATRQRMCEQKWNFFGPSVMGFRLSAYRRLPVGWSPAPKDVWSDLHMWRKFVRRSDLVFATHFSVHGVKLPAQFRPDMPLEERLAESQAIAREMADPALRAEFVARAFRRSWNELMRVQAQQTEDWSAQAQALAQLQATLDQERQAAQQTLDALKAAQGHAQAQAAQREQQALRVELGCLQHQHAQVLNARSWRWTAPLRWVRSRC